MVSGGYAAAAVSFDWATVGNAGNAADVNGFGAVAVEYRIAKHEVTNAQYAAFLNAVAATDPNGLYNTSMASGFGGITQSGSSGSFVYAARTGRENNPVGFVSWYDAARFINWLHNGQGNGDTESGVYTLTGPTASSGGRADDAAYFLPTEDEWYKSAYHDAGAGTAGQYFLYANGSNQVPSSDHPNNNSAGANYLGADGTYAVSGTTGLGSNPFTDVGAYANAPSPYGTFDQNGNVWEWTETSVDSSLIIRGGSVADPEEELQSSSSLDPSPTLESSDTGFRVAAHVPEAASLTVLAAGVPLLFGRHRR